MLIKSIKQITVLLTIITIDYRMCSYVRKSKRAKIVTSPNCLSQWIRQRNIIEHGQLRLMYAQVTLPLIMLWISQGISLTSRPWFLKTEPKEGKHGQTIRDDQIPESQIFHLNYARQGPPVVTCVCCFSILFLAGTRNELDTKWQRRMHWDNLGSCTNFHIVQKILMALSI